LYKFIKLQLLSLSGRPVGPAHLSVRPSICPVRPLNPKTKKRRKTKIGVNVSLGRRNWSYYYVPVFSSEGQSPEEGRI